MNSNHSRTHLVALSLLALTAASACTACGPAAVEDLPPPASSSAPERTGLEVDAPAAAREADFDVFDANGTKIREYQHAGTPVDLPAGTYTITRYMDARYVWAKDLVVADHAVAHVSLGAVRVIPVAGTADARFATLDPSGSPLSDIDEANAPIAAPEGDLLIADHMSIHLVYAAVHVSPLAVTDVGLGAIRVHVPAGTDDGQFSIWDEAKTSILREREERETIVAVGPGSYTLTRRLEAHFEYAHVTVAPGAIAEVSLGALRWGGAMNVNLSRGSEFIAQITPAFTYAIPAGSYQLADPLSAQPLAQPSVQTGAITVAN